METPGRRMAEIRTLIVDDEPPARERIRALLAEEPDLAVVGECDSGLRAIEAIRALRPDLVFLDVQMPGLDGFGVVDALSGSELPALVFVTAFDAYAVRAFEVHALDYLLKPFDRDRFRATLARARAALDPSPPTDDPRPVAAPLPEPEPGRQPLRRLLARREGRLALLRVSDIDWIESSANYATLHVGRESFTVRETMQSLEARLDPDQFLRIHRSTIVNLDRVHELEPYFHGDYTVRLLDGQRLTLSRTYRDRVVARLGRGL
jgi:two-component system LytT family response regulator